MEVRMIDATAATGVVVGGVVVVVDVMRAFTVAAWALARGATELRLVHDVEDAVALADTIPGALLCKDGAPDDRFHLHNSPRRLLELDVAGRTIVQRTTAGTRAAIAARHAERLYCASFVCASATARALRDSAAEMVSFVISGGAGADDDLACAELIAAIAAGGPVDTDHYIDRAAQSAAADDLREGVRRGFAGVTPDDVPMCLEVDRFDFAMRASDERSYLRLVRESLPEASGG